MATSKRTPKEGDIDLMFINCFGDRWHFSTECGGVTIEDDHAYQGSGGAQLHVSPDTMDTICRAWLRYRMGSDDTAA